MTRLLTDQLGTQNESPDAIIIAGIKVLLDKKVPLEPLKEGGEARCPIFYLNYNPDPIDQPWGDTIGSALKAYKGALAYNIILPKDLGNAANFGSQWGRVLTFWVSATLKVSWLFPAACTIGFLPQETFPGSTPARVKRFEVEGAYKWP